jgi:hypothetical protein
MFRDPENALLPNYTYLWDIMEEALPLYPQEFLFTDL